MDWFNMILGGAGLVIAIVAIVQTRQANAVAARALKMQEDQSLVRLVVEPRMLLVIGDGEDDHPRPVVRVINLSAFPLTVEKIWWKTDSPDGRGFFGRTHHSPLHSINFPRGSSLGRPSPHSGIPGQAKTTSCASLLPSR